ncbi:hypothetical protein DRJ17_06610 [Candidatus Woesearchaeota archaeon]|nr:MAG: hypothetical protein DRJ17_06610 [Candidatus Woesearchaeota archaeon]
MNLDLLQENYSLILLVIIAFIVISKIIQDRNKDLPPKPPPGFKEAYNIEQGNYNLEQRRNDLINQIKFVTEQKNRLEKNMDKIKSEYKNRQDEYSLYDQQLWLTHKSLTHQLSLIEKLIKSK